MPYFHAFKNDPAGANIYSLIYVRGLRRNATYKYVIDTQIRPK